MVCGSGTHAARRGGPGVNGFLACRPLRGPMSVLVEFSMSPLDKGASVGKYVARSLDLIDRSGVDYEVHSMGTILEGNWEECFRVIQACYERMAEDCARITVSVKVDARKGHDGRLRTKIRSVEERVGRPLHGGRQDG